jgi:hypothetical protein
MFSAEEEVKRKDWEWGFESYRKLTYFFLIGIVGGGVQLGPLGTAATNRPVVPAPGDYSDVEIGWMMTGKGNRCTRRKPDPAPLCPPETPHACPNSSHGWKPVTNRLSYGTVKLLTYLRSWAVLEKLTIVQPLNKFFLKKNSIVKLAHRFNSNDYRTYL